MPAAKEHLLQLTQLYMEQRDRTKDTQWKVNIGLWTLLTAAIYVGLDTNHPERVPNDSVLWILFALPVLHGVWVRQVSHSIEGDRALIHEWRARIEEKPRLQEPARATANRCWTWLLIQVGVTLILTAAAYLILRACPDSVVS